MRAIRGSGMSLASARPFELTDFGSSYCFPTSRGITRVDDRHVDQRDIMAVPNQQLWTQPFLQRHDPFTHATIASLVDAKPVFGIDC